MSKNSIISRVSVAMGFVDDRPKVSHDEQMDVLIELFRNQLPKGISLYAEELHRNKASEIDIEVVERAGRVVGFCYDLLCDNHKNKTLIDRVYWYIRNNFADIDTWGTSNSYSVLNLHSLTNYLYNVIHSVFQ